jgi:hypothetical protein
VAVNQAASEATGSETMIPVCRACGEPLGHRLAADTDIRDLDPQLFLCRDCFNEVHRGIILVWTDSPYKPSGTGTVPRQCEGRRKTDC